MKPDGISFMINHSQDYKRKVWISTKPCNCDVVKYSTLRHALPSCWGIHPSMGLAVHVYRTERPPHAYGVRIYVLSLTRSGCAEGYVYIIKYVRVPGSLFLCKCPFTGVFVCRSVWRRRPHTPASDIQLLILLPPPIPPHTLHTYSDRGRPLYMHQPHTTAVLISL